MTFGGFCCHGLCMNELIISFWYMYRKMYSKYYYYAFSQQSHGEVKFWTWVYKILDNLVGKNNLIPGLIPQAVEIRGKGRF